MFWWENDTNENFIRKRIQNTVIKVRKRFFIDGVPSNATLSYKKESKAKNFKLKSQEDFLMNHLSAVHSETY